MSSSVPISIRTKALNWWRSMSRIEQMQVFGQTERADQNWTFQMFAASGKEIEKAYILIHKTGTP